LLSTSETGSAEKKPVEKKEKPVKKEEPKAIVEEKIETPAIEE